MFVRGCRGGGPDRPPFPDAVHPRHQGGTYMETQSKRALRDRVRIRMALGNEPGTERPAGLTVLVVDDVSTLLNLFSAALRRQGYDVVVACNGIEAMRLAEAHHARIQLLLTDIDMPEMDGVLLWRALSAKWPEMRVLFMSGGVQTSGIDGQPFLRKPFTMPTLIRAVKEVLQNTLAASAATSL